MNDAARRQLDSVLDREIAVARSLAATLDAERLALTGTSPAEVLAKAAEKTALFASLEQLDLERRRVCDAAGIALPRRRGPTAGTAAVSGTLADRWQTLLELIAGCKIANDVNGYIIHARRGQLDQLFQVLRGGGPGITYGRHGKNFSGSPRELARA